MFERRGRAFHKKLNKKLLNEFWKDANIQKSKKPNSSIENRQKRLSSEEFLKFQDEIWKPGPQVRYKDPEKWYNETNYP